MIQTLPCPSCHRTLVLASEASLQAVLRCRHCSHQFVLGEMVEAELGFWEVIDDPNAPELKVSGTEHVAADDAVLELSMSKEYESPQALLKKQAEAKNVDWSKFEPISHEQYERMRRKGKSPIWSMLSVLLGGLASIPIATLLIWHVLGKDPLQMGPAVARYAPWIVPTRFQPSAPNFDEGNRPSALLPGSSGLPRIENVIISSSRAPDERASDEPLETTTTAQSRSDGNRDRRVPRAVSEGARYGESRIEGSFHREEPPNDVFTMINQVEKDLETWNERADDHKKLALPTYSNLASLALAIDQLPLASPLRRLVRNELLSVGQQVAQHADIQQFIQSGSRYWLSKHQDGLVGLAMVINVANATEVDNVWQITPTSAAGEEVLQIAVPKEILTSISAGQKVLVVGCLPRTKSPSDTGASDTGASDTGASDTGASESSPKSTSMLTANYVHVLEP